MDRNITGTTTAEQALKSPPSRRRGSKLARYQPQRIDKLGRLPRGGVDRNNVLIEDVRAGRVASLAEARIETFCRSRMRIEPHVASLAEAWIETKASRLCPSAYPVASLAEAWIETMATVANA